MEESLKEPLGTSPTEFRKKSLPTNFFRILSTITPGTLPDIPMGILSEFIEMFRNFYSQHFLAGFPRIIQARVRPGILLALLSMKPTPGNTPEILSRISPEICMVRLQVSQKIISKDAS